MFVYISSVPNLKPNAKKFGALLVNHNEIVNKIIFDFRKVTKGAPTYHFAPSYLGGSIRLKATLEVTL